jgi:hypothetical protein
MSMMKEVDVDDVDDAECESGIGDQAARRLDGTNLRFIVDRALTAELKNSKKAHHRLLARQRWLPPE